MPVLQRPDEKPPGSVPDWSCAVVRPVTETFASSVPMPVWRPLVVVFQ
ncbi:hypothetical protein CHKEEEPN_0525 [Methylorubrum podarium]|nr:hypothetical protein CHKEEEPN_0525 [Methylorubrum podarium]